MRNSKSSQYSSLIEYVPHSTYRGLYAIRHPIRFRNGIRKRYSFDENGNTLAPYDNYQCIFVHIPKTGGTAISKALFNGPSGGHDTLLYYKRIFTNREFDSYWKFSFIRNPYSRLLSAYHHVMSSSDPQEINWAKTYLHKYVTYERFVLEGIIKNVISSWIHFMPQYKFICFPNSIKPQVNFIGKFEQINKDFSWVARRLGVPNAQLYRQNIGRLSFNTDYRWFYSNEMIDVVSEIYAEDIRLFGYDF